MEAKSGPYIVDLEGEKKKSNCYSWQPRGYHCNLKAICSQSVMVFDIHTYSTIYKPCIY